MKTRTLGHTLLKIHRETTRYSMVFFGRWIYVIYLEHLCQFSKMKSRTSQTNNPFMGTMTGKKHLDVSLLQKPVANLNVFKDSTIVGRRSTPLQGTLGHWLIREEMPKWRTFYVSMYPIGSMYGIFTCNWLIFMRNVGKDTIHGSYGVLVYCTNSQTPTIIITIISWTLPPWTKKSPKKIGFHGKSPTKPNANYLGTLTGPEQNPNHIIVSIPLGWFILGGPIGICSSVIHTTSLDPKTQLFQPPSMPWTLSSRSRGKGRGYLTGSDFIG